MYIKLTPAKSSNISHTGYDPFTNTLAVQFKSGATYHYHGVPLDVYHALGKSESVGKFISANVLGKFKHSKLEA